MGTPLPCNEPSTVSQFCFTSPFPLGINQTPLYVYVEAKDVTSVGPAPADFWPNMLGVRMLTHRIPAFPNRWLAAFPPNPEWRATPGPSFFWQLFWNPTNTVLQVAIGAGLVWSASSPDPCSLDLAGIPTDLHGSGIFGGSAKITICTEGL